MTSGGVDERGRKRGRKCKRGGALRYTHIISAIQFNPFRASEKEEGIENRNGGRENKREKRGGMEGNRLRKSRGISSCGVPVLTFCLVAKKDDKSLSLTLCFENQITINPVQQVTTTTL